MKISTTSKKTSLASIGLVSILALAILTPNDAFAASKPWRANNHSSDTVKVFWTAEMCAGVKPACGFNPDYTAVCKTKILHPGEESEYKFPNATYLRKKEVCSMDRAQTIDDSFTTTRKDNGIRINEDEQRMEWYDE
uniref:Uncharacterized protein n=1 Tax=Candidatus Kentrum sp. UNK TaxID=2126344 RepID=A0A451B2U5_9GAMM|nr:MAG: hypothetical protein BECKUNK1418G_GA0071005_11339 [Candidatus Kentron sp. UNK]VFK72614.1 MAG: hypothetical protein BECKUNK1418H_GA0071006_11259 [Candidatus Kentron sp. UNK]